MIKAKWALPIYIFNMWRMVLNTKTLDKAYRDPDPNFLDLIRMDPNISKSKIKFHTHFIRT